MGPKATRCPSYTPHNLYLCWFKHNQSEPPDVVAASTVGNYKGIVSMFEHMSCYVEGREIQISDLHLPMLLLPNTVGESLAN